MAIFNTYYDLFCGGPGSGPQPGTGSMTKEERKAKVTEFNSMMKEHGFSGTKRTFSTGGTESAVTGKRPVEVHNEYKFTHPEKGTVTYNKGNWSHSKVGHEGAFGGLGDLATLRERLK